MSSQYQSQGSQHDASAGESDDVHLDAVAISIQESLLEAEYFDASSMAPLTPTSLAALARLRAFKPPPFQLVWDRLPLSRRAAVLVLLFADRQGDLRVVITMRSANLRSFSGHAAFPGGKADTLEESPFEIARREASEEIGLPQNDSKIPSPFRIEHICHLPFSLARNAIAVRPCVAFLHNDSLGHADVQNDMIPRLDAREVAAVFSAPFHNFLKLEHEFREGDILPKDPVDWYEGSWQEWHDTRWRMHFFHVPLTNQRVSKPNLGHAAVEENLKEPDDAEIEHFKVWGMTARVLVDAARLAYGEEPEFEHNAHFGDEALIESLQKLGKLDEKVTGQKDLSIAEIKEAADKAKENQISGWKM